MQLYKCDDGCCVIKINSYTPAPKYFNRNRKAGVVIYDPIQERVLLVQSRGHLWGPPKGTLNDGETEKDCAIREVKEETGITVTVDENKRHNIKNRIVYYYLEMDTCEVNVQTIVKDNDANGITWIKINCLKQEVIKGNIVLNYYARVVFKKFLNL
jgi:8-oxo-dGTP pyrophosphatase MutT (NUDIX family)